MMVAGYSLTTVAAAVLAVFCIIELGLTAHVANRTGDFSPDSINFLIFSSVWSLLVLAYLVLAPRFLPRLFHRFAPAALLVVTSLFWFAGAIAAADRLGTPDGCSRNGLCRSWQAGVAFAFFIWAIFTAVTVFEGLELRKHNTSATAKMQTQPGPTPYANA
ncbi:uncharacterized protein DNG_08851 [Cephalotrichum gorgonifer]|uniref:MARVEL domain-containing protein n=1 Tax=Cephalotrichum gorgonifer TaxID=2041049 RepID=A0AAE8N788_9PEZI|nr:uncharacterized protein DNG_08851 [Cephalotrichum gorgonifer]